MCQGDKSGRKVIQSGSKHGSEKHRQGPARKEPRQDVGAFIEMPDVRARRVRNVD